MRLIGYHLGQTIARTRALAIVLLLNWGALAGAQEQQNPTGTGVQPPSNEELIEKSNKSSVLADAIWIEITQLGARASRWVLDLNREGSCYVIRDQAGKRTIYGGDGIPHKLVKRAFTSLTKRSVIYGARKRPAGQRSDRQLMSIGMATWDGSRVYKTQSGSIDSYPEDVQKIIGDLRKSAEQLPVSVESMGSIQSTFLRPDEARRMLEGGRKIVTVEDPGRDAEQLSTLEMALRLPGRDIVVPTAGDWGALGTYVRASNPNEPDSGEFYVKSSARIFRVKMNRATGRGGTGDKGSIPRARPVGE